jgi:hypothetical protein
MRTIRDACGSYFSFIKCGTCHYLFIFNSKTTKPLVSQRSCVGDEN